MGKFQVYRKTRVEQVYEMLYTMITSPSVTPGEKLASVRTLAAQFDTSTFTVQQAIRQLEENGYVTTKPGSGTLIAQQHRAIAVHDMVALCIGGRGEHVWGDLSSMLSSMIFEKGQVPIVVERETGNLQGLLERMSYTGAKAFIVRGRIGFASEKMYDPPFNKKTVIAVVEWVCQRERPGLYRVLTDPHEGGRIVAEHLYKLGHRKVLIIGLPWEIRALRTPDIHVQDHGVPFAERFEALGGRWESIQSEFPEKAPCLDEEAFLSHFEGADPVTAVVGLRDVDAWLAQSVLRRQMPAMCNKIALVGYYDTPWGQAANPPITSVSLNLPEIAAKVREVLDIIHCGRTPENVYRISPSLVIRDTSVPARS